MIVPQPSRRVHPERGIAAAMLVVASPVLAAAAAAIRLSSSGPVLFRAERAGREGEPFTMIKLRTMHTSSTQHRITGGRDPRVFAAGIWLRRLKIDELPQLYNVLRGEMRFFGPRPEDLHIVRNHYSPWMWETLDVPPGIVGPGSLGYYLEEDQLAADPDDAFEQYVSALLPRKLARDLIYVRNPTIRYRTQLLLRTLAGVIGMRRLTRRWESTEHQRAEAVLRSLTDRDEVVTSRS